MAFGGPGGYVGSSSPPPSLNTRPHTSFQGRQRFGPRRRRIELRQDRFQRVEPWHVREGVIFERVPEMGDERSPLVIGEVENHDRLDIAAALADANTRMSSFRSYRRDAVGNINRLSPRPLSPQFMARGYWPGGTAPRLRSAPFFRKLAHDEKEALPDIRDYFRRRECLLAAIPVSARSPRRVRQARAGAFAKLSCLRWRNSSSSVKSSVIIRQYGGSGADFGS
jgi:hypothetical protein